MVGRRMAALAVATTLTALAWGGGAARATDHGTADDGGANRGPALGTEAPDFTLPSIDGREVTLSDLRGQPVVLVFFRGAW